MIRKILPIIIACICAFQISPTVYAQERAMYSDVNITQNKAYTAEEILTMAKEEYPLDDSMLDDMSWVLMIVNNDDFLNASAGSELMNMLYPSGLRLSTMLLDPSDTKYTASDYTPIYYGEEATLLRVLMPDRVNFTYSEIKAAAKYYRMIQAKSIAMGLPVFSFSEEFSGGYSEELINEFKGAVKLYENTFGAIGFPDTKGLSFDWVSHVEKTNNVDLSEMIIKHSNISDYRIPSGVNTINLFRAYYNNELTDEQRVVVYQNDKEITNDNLSAYTYDVQQAYMLACDYIPRIVADYDKLYSDIYIDSSTDIQTLADYLSDLQANSDKLSSQEDYNDEKKYSNDPFVQALNNQKKSPVSTETLNSLTNSDDVDVPTLFHGVCIAIAVITVLAIVLTKIVSNLRNR